MKRDTLIQAISQFALFSVALAAHDHKRGGREAWGEGGKRLAPYHFQDIPHCMVDCIYRMDRSDLPHVCSPFLFIGWIRMLMISVNSVPQISTMTVSTSGTLSEIRRLRIVSAMMSSS